ncbi:MAG: ABC transporter permease, partial [Rhodobacteraceae bacterium]|nr:ABC transporter permease [Paracoccaceae bacterium]
MSVAWIIARRELRGGLRGFRVFLACLTLGVAAIAAVGSVRDGIEAGVQREGAALLGGDAEIELTYRFAEPAERAAMEAVATVVSETVDFRSMATAPGPRGETERGLTQVRGVDGAYPIYGAVVLDPPMPMDVALAGQGGLPGGVMERVLMDRLGIDVGQTFRLGTQDFVVMAALAREPDSQAAGFGLGPRTIVSLDGLQGSGLLAPGTLFETQYRLRLPEGTDLDAARAELRGAFGEAGFRWRDRRNGAPGVQEFVDRLGSFLVLVGLAGLAVGGVGISAAVRAYLAEKTEVIATLKTLGAETRTIFAAYFWQIAVLAGAGIAAGLALGALVPLLLAPVIEAQLPIPAEIGVQPMALAEAALYGVLAAGVFTLWPLARTEEVRAATLFRDVGGGGGWPRPLWIAVTGGLFAVLVGAAAVLSGLWELTLWSFAGGSAAFVTLVAVGWLVRRGAARAARLRLTRGRTPLRLALGSVGGPGAETGSVILSLGLGLTVLAAVGQIDANLRGAIARDLPEVAPSFFVVDIQNDQLEGFRARLDADPLVTKVDSAPMLRGIITRINGRPAAEVAGDHWVIRGDRGVTYSPAPPPDTRVTQGAWWPADYAGPPQISFAEEEALEIGLKLGDRLTVNILGRDIEAEVTSFRVVDFSTAGIGFVMAMNPSALAGAPHTHIATIYADPAGDAALLRDLGDAYPNITLIRVKDAIDRVTEVLGAIAAATTYGALATLLTGFIVLIGAAAAGVRARTYEAAVLKTLGATRGTILASFALRSGMMGLAAGAVAILAGGLAGWGVSYFVMDTEFRFDPANALAIVAGGVAASMLAGLA